MLAQEVSQLGSACWDVFYAVMEKSDGTFVVMKGLGGKSSWALSQ